MTFTKETIDTLQQLRKHFKEEKLGVLRLSSEDIVLDIIRMARLSLKTGTRELALRALQQIGMKDARVKIDGKLFTVSSLADNPNDKLKNKGPEDNSNSMIYRGMTTQKNQSGSKSGSKPKRVYRGQEVA